MAAARTGEAMMRIIAASLVFVSFLLIAAAAPPAPPNTSSEDTSPPSTQPAEKPKVSEREARQTLRDATKQLEQCWRKCEKCKGTGEPPRTDSNHRPPGVAAPTPCPQCYGEGREPTVSGYELMKAFIRQTEAIKAYDAVNDSRRGRTRDQAKEALAVCKHLIVSPLVNLVEETRARFDNCVLGVGELLICGGTVMNAEDPYVYVDLGAGAALVREYDAEHDLFVYSKRAGKGFGVRVKQQIPANVSVVRGDWLYFVGFITSYEEKKVEGRRTATVTVQRYEPFFAVDESGVKPPLATKVKRYDKRRR